jgi:hypothetical protein
MSRTETKEFMLVDQGRQVRYFAHHQLVDEVEKARELGQLKISDLDLTRFLIWAGDAKTAAGSRLAIGSWVFVKLVPLVLKEEDAPAWTLDETFQHIRATIKPLRQMMRRLGTDKWSLERLGGSVDAIRIEEAIGKLDEASSLLIMVAGESNLPDLERPPAVAKA